jgi:hypothetical protein
MSKANDGVNMKRGYFFLPTLASIIGVIGCAAGHQLGNPTLSGLDAQLSSHNGEVLEPRFSPDVYGYTLRAQNDIFGVLLKPASADAGVTISVVAPTIAGAYRTRVAATDVNQPENVPLSTFYGQPGYLVKLSQSYASYDTAYTQKATISVTDASNGKSSNYVVNVVRDNDSAVRSKFGAEKVFTSAAGTGIKYRIYFPPNYSGSARTYPVVPALHGIGQRAAGGQPSDMVLKRTKQATIWARDSEQNSSKEAIVIAPQAN